MVGLIVVLTKSFHFLYMFVSDSSVVESFSDTNSSSEDFIIPINKNGGKDYSVPNKDRDPSFQLIKCYGYDVEFPLTKTPFPSQLSVMSTVSHSYSNNIDYKSFLFE